MQMVSLNALILFDAIFIFFLFLVSVSCLLYYLPLVPPTGSRSQRSRSRSSQNPEDPISDRVIHLAMSMAPAELSALIRAQKLAIERASSSCHCRPTLEELNDLDLELSKEYLRNLINTPDFVEIEIETSKSENSTGTNASEQQQQQQLTTPDPATHIIAPGPKDSKNPIETV